MFLSLGFNPSTDGELRVGKEVKFGRDGGNRGVSNLQPEVRGCVW